MNRRPTYEKGVRRVLPLAAGVALSLCVLGPLEAQDVPADTSRAELEAVLRRLETGERLRIQLLSGRTRDGRLAEVVPSGIVVASDGGSAVSTHEIERLWSRGNHAGIGALVGGGAGLLTGAVFGAHLGDFACADIPSEDCTLELALALGGIGAAGGAGLGALVGLLIPRWDRRWP